MFASSSDLLFGSHAGHLQAKTPLTSLSRFAEPPLTPFSDRSGQLRDLLDWATGTEDIAPRGRLYAAPGGHGKTRLALEAIKRLAAAGWQAGLLPGRASQSLDVRGEQDFEERLARFFHQSGVAGSFLVIDYAEGRIDDVLRVVRLAVRAAVKVPTCIVLLARSAGFWWERLLADDRAAQLTFDAKPHLTVADPLVDETRAVLFDDFAAAFATALAVADDGALLAANWRERPAPQRRLRSANAQSYLGVAFEAFLHVRGVDAQLSPLAEMAREERRHWERALNLGASTPVAANDRRIDMMHGCAALLTLLQGRNPLGESPHDALLDRVLELVADSATSTGTAVSISRQLSEVRTATHRLYCRPSNAALSLMPVRPDILGEHVAGSAPPSLTVLLERLAAFDDRTRAEAMVIVTRMRARHHDVPVRNAAATAIINLLKSAPWATADPVMLGARTIDLDIADVLTAHLGELDTETLQALDSLAPQTSPASKPLIKTILEEIARRDTDADKPDQTLHTLTISSLARQRGGKAPYAVISNLTADDYASARRAINLNKQAKVEDDLNARLRCSREAADILRGLIAAYPGLSGLLLQSEVAIMEDGARAGQYRDATRAMSAATQLLHAIPSST